MKCMLSLLLFIYLSADAFSQQINLVGVLKTDSGKLVPLIKVSVAGGQVQKTDPRGQFKIILSNDFKEGQRVLIKVFRDKWVINHPLDGEWNLPNLKEQNIKTLDVIIVPKGSKALWTHERIEKYVAKLSDEIAKLKKEGDTPKPINFSYYLSEWAKEYGFTPDEVKQQFDAWADAAANSDDDRKKGLSAFYQGKYDLAEVYFDKVIPKDEERVRQAEKQLEKAKLTTYQDLKVSGNVRSAAYKFRPALEKYEQAEKYVSKDRYPEEWTGIKFLIANMKQELGTRVKGQESQSLLSEAVEDYRQILTMRTREQQPQNWAATQNNLGIVLQRQGARLEGMEGAQLLAQAVDAYHEALKIYTREQLPQQWATTQNNLGIVWITQGERIEGVEGMNLLTQAVGAFREVLKVRRREQQPQDWAMTQNNLGVTLSNQGERLEGAEGAQLFAQSVEAYREALKVYTRKEMPQLWAMTQANLGTVLREQAERLEEVEGIKLLMQSVEASREALKVYTREEVPQLWAMTQNNLGNSLSDLGERLEGEEGERLLTQSIEVYREALKVRTRKQLPQPWAMTQNNLGNALRDLGARLEGAEGINLLLQAVGVYRDALTVYTREQLPKKWVTTQNNLARTYLLLRNGPEAAASYANVLTLVPDHKEAYSRLKVLYQDILFKFEEAFTLNQQWLARHPDDILSQADFAESYFTTSRFAECGQHISALLIKPEVSGNAKAALRAIEIADLLAMGQTMQIPARMEALITEISGQPAEFKVTWFFNGTIHFIGQNEKLSPYRTWLRQLFTALINPNRGQIIKSLNVTKAAFK